MIILKYAGCELPMCLGLRVLSVSLADSVDSREPSVSASELGDDRGTSLSKVTEERDERSEGLIERLFSLVFPVSQESQYISEVLSL